MKIANKNVMQIDPTSDERFCLGIANEALGEILNYLEDTCNNFEKGVLFYSPTTGEIVEDEEIMRARGILQFFLNNPLLEVRFQYLN